MKLLNVSGGKIQKEKKIEIKEGTNLIMINLISLREAIPILYKFAIKRILGTESKLS